MSGQQVAGSTRSKQDVGTPADFLQALYLELGPIAVDLAAHDDGRNAVAPVWIGPSQNALAQDWHRFMSLEYRHPLLWLNPPFKRIEPWAAKCAHEATLGARIALLTPASVDANWFTRHVHQKAMVMPLSPRLTFVGEDNPFPKPLILSLYGFGAVGFQPWRWK